LESVPKLKNIIYNYKKTEVLVDQWYENALFEGLGRETTRYKGGLGSKSLCNIPYKKIQKAPKIPSKGLIRHFIWEILKTSATSITLPLWPVRPWQGILRNQSTRGFFGFESSFKKCFWNLFITSGLSQICKIRNFWKLPSPFSRKTLILCFEICSCSWKTLFWKKIYRTNSKIMKSGVRVSIALGLLVFISLNHEVQRFTGKGFFMTVFEFIGQFLF
jgi:hypothetical protein